MTTENAYFSQPSPPPYIKSDLKPNETLNAIFGLECVVNFFIFVLLEHLLFQFEKTSILPVACFNWAGYSFLLVTNKVST